MSTHRSDSKRPRSRTPRIAEIPGDDSAGHRHARLQDLVERELAALLRHEVTDPRLQSVKIASVVLSVDYRHARVHYTVVRSQDAPPVVPDQVRRALEGASPFLRRRLAEEVEFKRVPELRFVFDGEAVG
jgi:ribosome-binding factor A